MKKLLAILLAAAMSCMGLAVAGCEKSPESIVSEKVDMQGWYTAFEAAYLSFCDGRYLPDGTTDTGTLPKNANCKLTYSDERAHSEREVILDGDCVYMKTTQNDVTQESYLQRKEDGNLTDYSQKEGGGWACSEIIGEAWERRLLYNSNSLNDVGVFLSKGYDLPYILGPNGEQYSREEQWSKIYVFDEARGGYSMDLVDWFGSPGFNGYANALFKIVDGKLSTVILSGNARSVLNDDETDDGCKAIISFVYGGQTVKIPPEVIEAATK